MGLESFYKAIDEHGKDGNREGFHLDTTGEELTSIHKELSNITILDIPSKYRKDVQAFLESSLFFPGAADSSLDLTLTKLLSDLRDA